MDEASVNDARLPEKARRGDEASFLDLYHRYRLPVFQFAWRLTGSETAGEDVAQESFLALLEAADYDPAQARCAPTCSASRGVAPCAVHVSEREAEEPATEADASAEPDALRLLLEEEREEMVGRAIGSLPVARREALVLFEYEESSLEEIAQVTGSESAAVKARLFRARESLRKRLAPLLAGPAVRSAR